MTNTIDSVNSTAKNLSWQLSALTEALGGLTLTVDDSLSVGRGSDNDVVLGSKQVSRNHALLSVLDGQLYVKDLDSSNGTFINEQRIEGNKSNLLQDNDTIGFASFSFRVNASVASTEASAPVDHVHDDSADNSNSEAASAQPAAQENIIAAQSQSIATESIATEPNPVVTEPVVKQTGIEEVLPATDTAPSAEPASEPHVPEPVVTKTSVDEILSAAEETDTAPTTATDQGPVDQTPAAEQPVAQNKPTTEPSDDKTTKTALQEEADPDVLRAKQAATAQFSGTANLEQSRDLGTEGNNAMDQAVSNPANAGQVEKKPSGSWFIWVFLAIIIVGLALWLFNMGGA